MADNNKKVCLFSFKVLVHRIWLTKLAFKEDPPVLVKPGIKFKFADFPHLIVMSRSSLYLDDFQDSQDFMTGKPKEEVRNFGKGKAAFFNATLPDMLDFLEKYTLVVQLKDFQHGSHKQVGTSLLNISMFMKDVQNIVSEDFERFRRNSFRFADKDNNCIGWFDMSISVLQRPVGFIQNVISKKLGVENLQSLMQKGYDVKDEGEEKQQDKNKLSNKQNDLQHNKGKELLTFGSQEQLKANIQNTNKASNNDRKDSIKEREDPSEYSDDFEASAMKSKTFAESSNYQDDFESIGMDSQIEGSSSYVGSKIKQQSNILAKDKPLSEFKTNKTYQEPINEASYSEDFESMSASNTGQIKGKND